MFMLPLYHHALLNFKIHFLAFHTFLRLGECLLYLAQIKLLKHGILHNRNVVLFLLLDRSASVFFNTI